MVQEHRELLLVIYDVPRMYLILDYRIGTIQTMSAQPNGFFKRILA